MTAVSAPIRLYLVRNAYGEVMQASFRRDTISLTFPTFGVQLKHRVVKTTKDCVAGLLQSGTSSKLFASAWRRAVADGQVQSCRRLAVDDGEQTLVYLREDVVPVLDGYLSELFNDPNSRFYLHG